jgi:NSS family neurotransmitter:Na+ symporter
MTAGASTWSGRLGFTLATIGAAVGIGSIWKFPYEVGENGGGGFILFYVAGLTVVVLPLMLAEFAIGRRGAGDAVTSIARLAGTCAASPRWAIGGWLGMLTGFLILGYYAVIGGWALGYGTGIALDGLPAGIGLGGLATAAQARFDAFLASPLPLAGWHAAFMALTVAIVGRGVGAGIEATATVLMPLLGVLMLLLAGYAIVEGDVATTLRYLFVVHGERLTPATALDALGLGFFSIGVGLGLMITYAAYSRPDIDLRHVALTSLLADTAISFLAGFAVFPLVFASGLDPAGGPGLVFVTLPIAFANLPAGNLVAIAFFGLLVIAALASAVSMLEVAVALAVRRFGWRRSWAAAGGGLLCYLLGVPCMLSFNVLADWHPLTAIDAAAHWTWYDVVDNTTSNLLLPAGGLVVALFAGWVLPRTLLGEELWLGARGVPVLRWLLRYVVPACVIAATLAPLLT